jgi:hypothetical protein
MEFHVTMATYHLLGSMCWSGKPSEQVLLSHTEDFNIQDTENSASQNVRNFLAFYKKFNLWRRKFSIKVADWM